MSGLVMNSTEGDQVAGHDGVCAGAWSVANADQDDPTNAYEEVD